MRFCPLSFVAFALLIVAPATSVAAVGQVAVPAPQSCGPNCPWGIQRLIDERSAWAHYRALHTPHTETKEECQDRLTSRSPSKLELALTDLKCSQRAHKKAGNEHADQ